MKICHAESAFQFNEGQRYSRLQEDQQVIKPKSKGSGRMVSDFIDDYFSSLRLSDAEFATAKQIHPDISQEA